MRALRTLFTLIVPLSAGCGGNTDCEPVFRLDETATRDIGGVAFIRRVVADSICGPAYVRSGDLNGDGTVDLLVSALGPAPEGKVPPGTVTALLRDGKDHTAISLVSVEDAVRFPNRPTLADLDADGDLDALVPLGFFPCSFELFGTPCGGLLRFDNDGVGGFTRHDIVAPGDATFHHGVERADLDGDGVEDLVTIGERRGAPWDSGETELVWHRGEGGGRFEPPQARGTGLSTFPAVADIDDDGDVDVAGAEFLGSARASYAWLENPGNKKGFVRHVISDSFGPGFGLQFEPDLLGDGRLVALGTNHTNPIRRDDDPAPALVLLIPGADPRAPWETRVLLDDFAPEDRSGQFAPGLFGTGDLDGDGRRDIVVSGDGDPRVFVLLQTSPGEFTAMTLETDLGQAGGMHIADLDGDGANELVVTGYEDHVVFIYTRTP